MKKKEEIASIIKDALIRETLKSARKKKHSSTKIVINKAKFGCEKPHSRTIKLKNTLTEETVEFPIGDYLCSAARRGDIKVLTGHIDCIDSVDSDGRSVLMIACLARRLDVVDWYLAKFPEGKRTQLFSFDDYSCGAVHFASGGGKIFDNQNNPACMKAILDAGADINATDELGYTALHIAAQNGFEMIVDELLSRETCHLGILDCSEKTAAYHARVRGCDEMADKIEKAIAAGAGAPVVPLADAGAGAAGAGSPVVPLADAGEGAAGAGSPVVPLADAGAGAAGVGSPVVPVAGGIAAVGAPSINEELGEARSGGLV